MKKKTSKIDKSVEKIKKSIGIQATPTLTIEEKKDGRPTKFKEEYCNDLIEHMGKGYSFESFAADCNVDRDTIYHWCKIHANFSDAKKIAVAKCQKHWEKLCIENIFDETNDGYSRKLNPTLWIFNMKNRFKWTDKLEVTEKPIEKMTDEELKQELQELGL